MKIRHNLLFLPLLVVCAGVFWYLGLREERQVAARHLADRALVDISRLDIIEIIRPDEALRMEKTSPAGEDATEVWQMVEPFEAGCNPDAVTSLIDAIFEIQSERDFTGVTPEHETEFGLDEPEIRIRLASSSGMVLMDLAFGYENPSGTSRYAALADDHTQAFLVPIFQVAPFEAAPNAFRDVRALAFNSDDLVSIQLSSAAAEIQLEMQDHNWMVTAPGVFAASPQRIGILVHDLLGLQIDEFLDQNADNPELRRRSVEVRIAMADGSIEELTLRGEDLSRGIFATSSWQPSPFIVGASIYDRLVLDPNVFFHVLLIDFPDEIGRILVRQPGSQNLEIERTGSGPEDWRILRPEDRVYTEPGDFGRFIDALLALQPENSVPLPEKAEDYGLEPVYFLKIEVYRQRDMGQAIIYLGSRDEIGHYYSTQDGNSYFTINGDLVSEFISATNTLKGNAQ